MAKFFEKLIYNRWVSGLVNRYYDLRLKDLDKLIFVATTGRSGTLTLVDVFNEIDGCVAEHEPYPAMHDTVLADAARGDEKSVENFYAVRKSVNIRRSSIGAKFYLEANHLFIKTFVKYAAEDFSEKIKVIHLVRDPVKVANSIFSLEDQPGTAEGNRWWLDYRAPCCFLPMADVLDGEFSHPYYKALWYWFEVEARVAFWKKELPHVSFVFFQTENFKNKEKLAELFFNLGIEVSEDYVEEMTAVRSHGRSHQKKKSPLSEEEAREMLGVFKGLLGEKGFSLPDTLKYYE